MLKWLSKVKRNLHRLKILRGEALGQHQVQGKSKYTRKVKHKGKQHE